MIPSNEIIPILLRGAVYTVLCIFVGYIIIRVGSFAIYKSKEQVKSINSINFFKTKVREKKYNGKKEE